MLVTADMWTPGEIDAPSVSRIRLASLSSSMAVTSTKLGTRVVSRKTVRKLGAVILVLVPVEWGLIVLPTHTIILIAQALAVVNTLLLLGVLLWAEFRPTSLLRRQALARFAWLEIASGLVCAGAVTLQLGMLR
jgi:hypothetical protein